MADTVVFRSKRGVVGAVRYVDGKLQVKGSVADIAKMWLDRGQDAKDFVPHYLGWSNGYLVGETPGSVVKDEPRDGDNDGFVYDGTPMERPAVPDFPMRLRLEALRDHNANEHTRQFATTILDLCEQYPNVAANLKSINVMHDGDINPNIDAGVPPRSVVASAGAREHGWALNFWPDHVEEYLTQKKIQALAQEILGTAFPGDKDQKGPVTHIGALVDLNRFVEATAVHEFGHLVQNHVFVVQWQNLVEMGFDPLPAWDITFELKQHHHPLVRQADPWFQEGDEDFLIHLDKAMAPEILTKYATTSNSEAGAEYFAAAHYGLFGVRLPSHWEDALAKQLNWKLHGIEVKKAMQKWMDDVCEFDSINIPLLVAIKSGLERNNGQVDVSKVKSNAYPDLERKKGGPDNWVEQAGGLPSYIERIAKHLHYERGMDIGRAIATAVSRCRMWAAGGGGVGADTKAKAAKAIAEWEAKKTRAKAD